MGALPAQHASDGDTGHAHNDWMLASALRKFHPDEHVTHAGVTKAAAIHPLLCKDAE